MPVEITHQCQQPQAGRFHEPKDNIQRLILERMLQIIAFWRQAHDRRTSTLTTEEIYQALAALPEPDDDRQSRRGHKAIVAYYRAQLTKRSGRRKGGQAPKTELIKMLCRLFIDTRRRAVPFSEPAGGRALREFVYAGLDALASLRGPRGLHGNQSTMSSLG
jgi:cytochrome P450